MGLAHQVLLLTLSNGQKSHGKPQHQRGLGLPSLQALRKLCLGVTQGLTPRNQAPLPYKHRESLIQKLAENPSAFLQSNNLQFCSIFICFKAEEGKKKTNRKQTTESANVDQEQKAVKCVCLVDE